MKNIYLNEQTSEQLSILLNNLIINTYNYDFDMNIKSFIYGCAKELYEQIQNDNKKGNA